MALVDAAALRKKLDQVRQGGHAALGLSEGASEDAVRQAYLDACKRYHPNRFARDPDPACKAIAQEIFIEVKRAYETLGGASKRPAPASAKAVRPGTLPPGPVPEPKPPAGQGGPPRPGTPPLRQPTAPSSGPMRPLTAPTTTPMRPLTPPITTPVRPLTPPITTPVRPLPPAPAAAPAAARTPTPAPAARAPSSTPAAGAAKPPSAFELTRGRELRYQAALVDSAAGRHADARRALSTLSTESQDKRFRVQLFVVWGHELKAEGKLDLAQGHYENALALDAGCEDARRALAGLAAARAGRR